MGTSKTPHTVKPQNYIEANTVLKLKPWENIEKYFHYQWISKESLHKAKTLEEKILSNKIHNQKLKTYTCHIWKQKGSTSSRHTQESLYIHTHIYLYIYIYNLINDFT